MQKLASGVAYTKEIPTPPKIQVYIRKVARHDDLLSECFRQQKLNEEKEEEERQSWRDKPLHGMFPREIEAADIEKTYQLLEKAGLMNILEALKRPWQHKNRP